MWSNTAAAATRLGRVNRYIDYNAVSKNWASLVGEKSYAELDNQISEMARLMRTEKKTWWWSLRNASETWDLRDWGTRESSWILAKTKIMCQIWRYTAATGLCIPDLEQHRCSNRTVYGSFRSEDSRCGAAQLLRDCVRVNSFGTGSQHIPDLGQHPYHMLVNSCRKIR